MLIFCLSALAAPLAGNYTLAEPTSTVQARVDAAIAAALSAYPSPITMLATPKLKAKATFCAGYAISTTATSVTVSCDGAPGVPGVFGATSAPWTSKAGDVVKVTTTAMGDGAELRFDADGGYQVVRYTPTDSGLTVQKTLHSDQLGLDLTWTMSYRREP